MSKVTFYYGAMNAGKTTTLIQKNYEYNNKSLKSIIIKPAIDSRVFDTTASYNTVNSRIGLKASAILVLPHDDINDFINMIIKLKPYIVMIDEVQFLEVETLKLFLHRLIDEHIFVNCFGLRNSFNGKGFEASNFLLANADQLIEMKSVCHCGNDATHNLLVIDNKVIYEGESIHIGGDERYFNVCYTHYRKGIFVK